MITVGDMDPGVVLGAGCLSIWLYLAIARGGFWQVWRLTRPAPPLPEKARHRSVAVVIPARNEADVIGRTVTSLLHQDHEGPLRIVVVDDHSDDGTAAAAALDDRVSVLQGRPLQEGWTGKMWAVEQGVARAREFRPDYILLTDADIMHAADNVRLLLARAETARLDLVSLMVRLHCGTLPERMLIPAFVFFFFQLYPPAWIADIRKATAGAAGGCMLIRPEALDRIGGIEAIRGELIDDCALARAVKSTGGGVWLGLGTDTYSTREYRTFGEIWNMIARTAFTQLHYSGILLLGTVLGLIVTYVAPPVLGLSGHVTGLAAWAILTVLYLPILRYYRVSPVWAPLLPLSAVFYLGATISSALRYWSGKGGQWKGRAQAAR